MNIFVLLHLHLYYDLSRNVNFVYTIVHGLFLRSVFCFACIQYECADLLHELRWGIHIPLYMNKS